MVETAKLALVTIIAASELEDGLIEDLRALGVKGYTVGKVNGRGTHGPRISGFFDTPNLHFEILVPPALGEKILEHIVAHYSDRAIIAYVQDVRAVPREHFA
jgi:nitrogen regulatory protein P-II 2